MSGCPTLVARIAIDAATAALLQNAIAECCDGLQVAVSVAEENGSSSLMLHFRDRPDELEVRNLFASISAEAIGQERARSLARRLVLETLAPTDWVSRSLQGLTPVAAGRFVVHGAHDRAHIGVNRIAVQI